MAITTFAELKTALANFSHSNDLTDRLEEFIALCEGDMQARLKLLEFETSATVTITSGSGTLPTGFLAMRSVYWDGNPDRELTYVTPLEYDRLRDHDSGDAYHYTISGSTIRTTPMGSGSVVCTYNARFTALSAGNPSNAILTNFPNAYLYGALLQLAIYTLDDVSMQKYGLLFNSYIDRINQNNEDRKYAGGLVVRAR